MEPPSAGLAGVVIEQMGDAYPELVEHADEIQRIARRRGGALRRDARARHEAIFEEARREGEITGDDAFDLQATYGFPIELTQELARERGPASTTTSTRELMEGHREISRAGGESSD